MNSYSVEGMSKEDMITLLQALEADAEYWLDKDNARSIRASLLHASILKAANISYNEAHQYMFGTCQHGFKYEKWCDKCPNDIADDV